MKSKTASTQNIGVKRLSSTAAKTAAAPVALELLRPGKRIIHPETSKELGEKIVASCLYQTFLYDWLDRNGHGRTLADGDL